MNVPLAQQQPAQRVLVALVHDPTIAESVYSTVVRTYKRQGKQGILSLVKGHQHVKSVALVAAEQDSRAAVQNREYIT